VNFRHRLVWLGGPTAAAEDKDDSMVVNVVGFWDSDMSKLTSMSEVLGEADVPVHR
jgi:hypothetical protein